MGTEFVDGSINLANSTRSLLGIYFRDFATENDELKEITVDPTEVTVTFDDRFIAIDEDAFAEFYNDKETLKDMFDFRTKTSDDETYYSATEKTVYVYVPEEVMEDVEDLKNREFTVILGEDNIAVAISVEDDIVETAFLTDFDGTDEIVVDGEEYKLAMASGAPDYKVIVNGVEYDSNASTGYANLTAALNAILDNTDKEFEDIEKKIEATLTLNSKGKVEAIELFASANTLDNTIETVVEEVKNSKTKYTIYNTVDEIVVEDDFEELPKVYIDGVKGELSDIEAGNVLTIITDANSDSEVKINKTPIAKIYVSTETVVGEPNRVRKSNNAIEIDGTEYTNSEKLSKVYVEELEDGAETATFTADTIMNNDEVTLYLNIFGEYVAVYVEDGSSSEYQFGVVTRYYSSLGSEGEDDEIDTRNIKIMTEDATKSSKYTLKLDTSDDEINDTNALANLKDTDVENKLVMFIADADGNIHWEDFHIIENATDAEKITDLADYTFFETTTVDGKKVVGNSDKYRYSAANTVMFNVGGVKAGTCGAKKDGSHVDGCDNSKAELTETACTGKYDIDAEVITDWSKILTNATTIPTAICVLDKNETLVCISLLVTGEGTSDTEYAVVSEEIYIGKDMDTAKLLLDGSEVTLDAEKGKVTDFVTGAFISYEAPSDKIKTAKLLLDVVAFNKLLTDTDKKLSGSEIIPEVEDSLTNKDGDKFAWAENLEVENIYFDADAKTEEYEIEYVEIKSTEDAQVAQLDGFYITEDDTTVYDLRGGNCDEMTMKALMTAVENGEEVYVIRVVNETNEVVLVVLGEIAE